MKAAHLLVEFYNPAMDELGQNHFDDTRRPRLTLSHIQALRKSKDVAQVDRVLHYEFLPDMYSPPDDTEAPVM